MFIILINYRLLALFQVHMRCCVSEYCGQPRHCHDDCYNGRYRQDSVANSSSRFHEEILESFQSDYYGRHSFDRSLRFARLSAAHQHDRRIPELANFHVPPSVVSSTTEACTLFVMIISALLALIFGPINTGLLASWHYLLLIVPTFALPQILPSLLFGE
jgi:hypothetical protein